MISTKTLKTIEFDKITEDVGKFAVLERTKSYFADFIPETDIKVARAMLDRTAEAYKLLYDYDVGGIVFFTETQDEIKRVESGGTLTIPEILRVVANLKSARILKESVLKVKDETIKYIPEIASRLFINKEFEKEISEKIASEDDLTDNASPKLYSIRKSIRNINAQIRDELNGFMRGNSAKYLQDGVITVRGDRYVVPVKSEYRSFIKGFIHDQSSSGATVFIEPEIVIELNNKLKSAMLDEEREKERILYELSSKISFIAEGLKQNEENISEADGFFARAIYSFVNKYNKPVLNDKGIIKVFGAKHPLIDKNKVVPIDFEIGDTFSFMLITGPNTGGKTVTLKLCGLITLMAMSGLFVPANSGAEVSVFDSVFCDIGDEQSIEQSLSTFSSHIKNIKFLLENADRKSLVLLDEIGAGTDPEEGSALALAIIEKLLFLGAEGIITTHYARLKEFAAESGRIENASMEFDPVSLKPLYKLDIGIPGSSNAIEIAKTLGIDGEIINKALSYLSDDTLSFEEVLKKAEEERRRASELSEELEKIKKEREKELDEIAKLKEEITKEKDRIYYNAKQETKRIVADKLADAEEIVSELKEILKRANLESKDVFKAGELKNRLQNSKYLKREDEEKPFGLKPADILKLKKGDKVFVETLGAFAVFDGVNKKGESEVFIGNIKSVVKSDKLFVGETPAKTENKITVSRKTGVLTPVSEINLLGKTAMECVTELENFIDQAVLNNLEEIKIIHGYGSGVLAKTVREYLKNDKRIAEYRKGKYGEGENGVTIAKLK